jgi:class 3 adenylate cyclase
MRYGPRFDFARRQDGRRVAYQVVGDGDLDLVLLFGWPTNLGLTWEDPSFAAFLGKLAWFSRLILYGRLALMLAATYPDEMSSVVTFGSHPATLCDEDYPWGTTVEAHEGLLVTLREGEAFDDGAQFLEMVAPRESADASVAHWMRMFIVSAATFAEQYEGIRSLGPVDIRGLLGSVQAPVLVLHRTGDQAADVQASCYVAERIPGARFVELPGDAHFPFFGDQDAVVHLTQEFLTAATPVVEPDRVLATVLFTDAGLRDLELEIPVGLHTGECGLLGDDIGGIAGHIAARVLGQAGAREILCSRTVKDLVAGAGFAFADRGTRTLKGVPDSWQLYAVELAER